MSNVYSVILYQNHLVAQIISIVPLPALWGWEWDLLKLLADAMGDFHDFASEARIIYSDTVNFTPRTRDVKSYGASYALECVVFGKIAKI